MLKYIILLSMAAILFLVMGIAIKYFKWVHFNNKLTMNAIDEKEKINITVSNKLIGNVCFAITIIMVLLIILINVGDFVRKLENKAVIENRVLKIQGMYATNVPLKDINSIFILNRLPKVKSKIYGFESGDVLKGKFILQCFEFGKTQLYIQNKKEAYILIFIKKGNYKRNIIINFKDKNKTKKLFKELNTVGQKYKYKYAMWKDTLMAKPVIYLYPEKKEEVSVKLNFKGDLGFTYPKYSNKWNVIANTDGSLIDMRDNAKYSYLFWEGTTRDLRYDFSKGFVIKGEDTEKFLREKLSYMGLTPHEYNDFIVYWLPQMYKNKYNLIHFAGKEYEDIANLQVEPKPDSILRVYMEFKPLEKFEKVDEQELKPFKRNGFSVVEWGGSKIN